MTKGGSLSNGPRFNTLNISFWRKFKRETGIDIEYRDFVSIIEMSNRRIKQRVLDNLEGFKLPENLGYLSITKYKSTKRKIDFNKTKELGMVVYHTNLHSGGMDARVMWWTDGIAICKNIGQYKFVPDRDFQKKKSVLLQSGKTYKSSTYKDFKLKKIRLNLDRLFYGE